MDVKETLTRWSRAYMEPSLFYVPVKKNDEYYNITFHMMVDYFDTVDEKILTNMTIEKLWDKYRKNTSDWAHAKYGSIGENVNTESSFFVAYDTDGNIADCSLWRDAMSFSEIAETEEIDEYVIETYRITKVPHMYYGWYRRVIKNIPNEETIDTLFETYQNYNISLYVLHSGEVYMRMFDRYDAETKKYYYKKQKIGTYNYVNGKFSIDDENVYYDYMIIGNNSKWNNYNGTPTFFGYTSSNDNNITAPMLMLKKGTYIIKQIVSATGCELMKPFTITVEEDKTIYYKINLKGLIQRAELVDCNDGYHKLYDGFDSFGSNDKWTIDASKSYGSLETINYTYRLSDNKLLVRQRCSNGYSGSINIVHAIMGEQNEKNRWIACSGKIVRYYLTYGGYPHEDGEASLYDDDTIVADMYNVPLSKRPLNKQELQLMGITTNDSGIQISTGNVYFYDNIYMTFSVGGGVYNPYETNIGYEEYQNRPTADEIAMTINKRSLSEWYITRDEKDEHGQCGLTIKDDGHSRWYVQYSGWTHSIYDYHNLSYSQRLLDETTGSNRDSQINVVLDYYKSDNIDIENVKKYMTNSIQSYNHNYNYDEGFSKNIYKNYLTLFSSEVKQDPDWNEEKFNKFQTEMRHRLYEEQLK